LNGEAELVQQSRDVVVVIADTKPRGDEVTNHRSCPHTACVSGNAWSVLDESRQLGALGFVELGRGAWGLAGQQTFDTERFVPSEPTIDRTARHTELAGEYNDAPALDVSEDRPGASPNIKVVALDCCSDQPT
jgi:hypothetical protein